MAQRYNRFSSRSAQDKYLLDYHKKDQQYAEDNLKLSLSNMVNNPPFIVSGGRLVRSIPGPTQDFTIAPMIAIDRDFRNVQIPTKLSAQNVPSDGTWYVVAEAIDKEDSSSIGTNFTTGLKYAKIIEDSYKITYKNAANVSSLGSLTGSSAYVDSYANANKISIKIDANDAREVNIPDTLPGEVETANAQNYTISAGVNDKINFTIDVNTFDVTLTAGSRTALQIANEINAEVQLVTPLATVAFVTSSGTKVTLRGNDGTDFFDIDINATANDAYTILGLTVGTYTLTNPTLSDIITAINTEFDQTIAYDSAGALKIETQNNPGSIALETVANDFYAELFFTSGSSSDSVSPVDLDEDIILGKITQAFGDITIDEELRTRSVSTIKPAVSRDEDGNVKATLGHVNARRNVVLQSPDTTLWTITVDDNGTLLTSNTSTVGAPTTITFLTNTNDFVDMTVSNAGVLGTTVSVLNEETGLVLESNSGFVYSFDYTLAGSQSSGDFIVETSEGMQLFAVHPNNTFSPSIRSSDPAIVELTVGQHWWNSNEEVLKFFDGTSIQTFRTSSNRKITKFFEYPAFEITNDLSQANSRYYRLFNRRFVPGEFFMTNESGIMLETKDGNSLYPSLIRDVVGGGTGTNHNVTTNLNVTSVNITTSVTQIHAVVIDVVDPGNSTNTTVSLTDGATVIKAVTVPTSSLVVGKNIIELDSSNLDLLTYQLKINTDAFTNNLVIESNGTNYYHEAYYMTERGEGGTDSGFNFASIKPELENAFVKRNVYPPEVDTTIARDIKIAFAGRYIIYTYYKTTTATIEFTAFDVFLQKTVSTQTVSTGITHPGLVQVNGDRSFVVEADKENIWFFYGSVVDGSTSKIYFKILDTNTMTLGTAIQVNEYQIGVDTVKACDLAVKDGLGIFTFTVSNRTDTIGDPGFIGTYAKIYDANVNQFIDTELNSPIKEFYVGEIGNETKPLILVDYDQLTYVFAIQRGNDVRLKLLSKSFNFVNAGIVDSLTKGFLVASNENLVDIKVVAKRAFIVTSKETGVTGTPGTSAEIEKFIYVFNTENFFLKKLTTDWKALHDLTNAQRVNIDDWFVVNDEVFYQSHDFATGTRITYAHDYDIDVIREVKTEEINGWSEAPFAWWEEPLDEMSTAMSDGGLIGNITDGILARVRAGSTSTAELYTIATDSWSPLASGNTDANSPGIIKLSDSVSIVGLVNGSGGVFKYDSGVPTSYVGTDPVPAPDFSVGSSVAHSNGLAYFSLGNGDFYSFDHTLADGFRWSAALTAIPFTPGAGSRSVGDGTYIYMSEGGSTTTFRRYNISGNSWGSPGDIAQLPVIAQAGSAMAYDDNDTIIYAPGGTGVHDLWKYSISEDTWTQIIDVPGLDPQLPGFSMFYYKDFVWIASGGDQGFYKYDIENNTITLPVLPELIDTGSHFVSDGTDIYFFPGGIDTFYKIDTTNNSITQLTNITNPIDLGACSVSSGNYIYTLVGGSTSDFYRYDKTLNTWSTLATTAATLGTISVGASMTISGGFIYATAGTDDDNAFAAYDITLNSWADLTDLPTSAAVDGASLVATDIGIYHFTGGGSTEFFRYSPGTDTWTTDLATASTPTRDDGSRSLLIGDIIYHTTGAAGSGRGVYRYDYQEDVWSEAIARTPAGMVSNTSIGYANEYIYMSSGDQDIHVYDTLKSTKTSGQEEIYFTIGAGGSAVAASGTNLYVVDGGSTEFYKYDTELKEWTQKNDIPFAIAAGSASVASNGIIYVMQGSSTDFFDYTIATDTWGSSLAVIPASTGDGAFIVSDGTDLYAGIGGATTGFHKYDVGLDSWSAMAVVPFNMDAGGSAIYYNGTIYAFGGGSTQNYASYDIETDTWTDLTGSPTMPITIGAGSDSVVVDNFIFVNPGTAETDTGFYRFNLTTMIWEDSTTLPELEVNAAANSNMVVVEDKIYFLFAGGTDFYSFSTIISTVQQSVKLYRRNNLFYSFAFDVDDNTNDSTVIRTLDTTEPVAFVVEAEDISQDKIDLGNIVTIENVHGFDSISFYGVNIQQGKVVFRDVDVDRFIDESTELICYFYFSTSIDELRADNLLAEGSGTSVDRLLSKTFRENATFLGDKTFLDNVIVTKDLTVLGELIAAQSTTLTVEGRTLELNVGGNDTTAQGSGFIIERTSTNGSLIFDVSTVSKWKAGLAGLEKEVVTTAGGQALEGNLTILAGGVTVTGNSGITGTLNLSNTLTISSGGASVAGGLTISSGGLTSTGTHSLTGALTVVGADATLTRGSSTILTTRSIVLGGAREGDAEEIARLLFRNYDFSGSALDIDAGSVSVQRDGANSSKIKINAALSGTIATDTLVLSKNAQVGIKQGTPEAALHIGSAAKSGTILSSYSQQADSLLLTHSSGFATMMLEGQTASNIYMAQKGGTANQRLVSLLLTSGRFSIIPLEDNGLLGSFDYAFNIHLNNGGRVGIGTSATARSTLHILTGSPLASTSTSNNHGWLLIGDLGTDQLGFNANSIQRYNTSGDPSTLSFNPFGGNLSFSPGSSGGRFLISSQVTGGSTALLDVQNTSTTTGLAISGKNSSNTSPTAQLHNDSTGASADILELRYTSVTSSPAGSNNHFVYFVDAAGTVIGGARWSGAGTITYETFTGSHNAKIINNDVSKLKLGMILESTGQLVGKSTVTDAALVAQISTKARSKNVYGIYESHWIPKENKKIKGWKDDEYVIGVAALGDGAVLVTDINGKVEAGDFITTSDIPGYGMRQGDDTLRNYTVAKVVESVNWDNVTETISFAGKKYKVALVGCTYHCG